MVHGLMRLSQTRLHHQVGHWIPDLALEMQELLCCYRIAGMHPAHHDFRCV